MYWNAAVVQKLAHTRGSARDRSLSRKSRIDGSVFDNRLIFRHLAIQYAQRIRHSAPLAIGAHLRRDFAQFLAQRFVVADARFLRPDGVDQQLETADADFLQQGRPPVSITSASRPANRSRWLPRRSEKTADSGLSAAAPPEHRPDVVELLQARLLIQPVFDVGAQHRCRVLRAQRQRTSVAILKRVHLFADDVGFFTDAAREQRSLFQDRRANLAGN